MTKEEVCKALNGKSVRFKKVCKDGSAMIFKAIILALPNHDTYSVKPLDKPEDIYRRIQKASPSSWSDVSLKTLKSPTFCFCSGTINTDLGRPAIQQMVKIKAGQILAPIVGGNNPICPYGG